jgi:RNA polymerase sigma factor (sigma-70 family)
MIDERAKSKAQQRLFGIARSIQKGERKASSVGGAAARIAKDLSVKKTRDFARTKHEELPKRVKEAEEADLEAEEADLEADLAADLEAEEADLAVTDNDPQDPEALVTANEKLAYWLAARHASANPSLDPDDIRQEALLALTKAANTYTPGKGSFAGYASQIIRNHLGKMSYKAGTYSYKGKASPYRISRVELDAPIGDDEGEGEEDYHSKIAAPGEDPAQYVARTSRYAWAKSEVSKLDPRSQKALNAWVNGKTYDEIGKMLHMTKMGAYKVVQGALSQLRKSMRQEALEERRLSILTNKLLED